MSNSLPACLLNRALYPHCVSDLKLIETHISWVVLTGDFVYKFKKPVDLGFVDFSSLEKRHFFCQEELRLNSRLAADLYLGVVPLCSEHGKLRLGEGGEIVDYAVKMKQFSQESLLGSKAAQGDFDLKLAEQVAIKLAKFHTKLFTQPSEPDPSFGSFAAVSAAVLDNFSTVRPLISETGAPRIDAIEAWSREALCRLEGVIEQRCQSGKIRECHGDLHLGNMALIDGTVTFFDCIEFNPAFRFVDVICELAFVLMDLESRGLFVEANHVLNTYLEYRDDYEGLALLNFYKVYFAMVRAKVALIQSQAKGVPSETFGHDKMPLSQRYVGLAERYLKPPHRYCALMHGVSGSGKTTVARQISAKTGAIQVRSDVERKRIAGLLPNEKSIDTLADSIYTKAFSEKTFRRLEILSQTVLAAGYPVIVDATFLSRKSRAPFEALAAVCGLPCHILNTVANEVSLRKRLEKREKEGGDASEAGVKVMLAQCKNLEGFSESERERVITISSEHILIDDIASALQL